MALGAELSEESVDCHVLPKEGNGFVFVDCNLNNGSNARRRSKKIWLRRGLAAGCWLITGSSISISISIT